RRRRAWVSSPSSAPPVIVPPWKKPAKGLCYNGALFEWKCNDISRIGDSALNPEHATRPRPAVADPVRKEFLVFGRPAPYEADIDEVVATLRSGWIGPGPKVGRFEEAFRSYIGARHALALNSCTAALHLSMIAAGIGPGDEVITTPHT